jgi:hypothetical protein
LEVWRGAAAIVVRSAEPADLREPLSRALRDPTVSVAYWLLIDIIALAYPSRRFQSAWMGIVVHSVQSVVVLGVILALVLGSRCRRLRGLPTGSCSALCGRPNRPERGDPRELPEGQLDARRAPRIRMSSSMTTRSPASISS